MMGLGASLPMQHGVRRWEGVKQVDNSQARCAHTQLDLTKSSACQYLRCKVALGVMKGLDQCMRPVSVGVKSLKGCLLKLFHAPAQTGLLTFQATPEYHSHV